MQLRLLGVSCSFQEHKPQQKGALPHQRSPRQPKDTPKASYLPPTHHACCKKIARFTAQVYHGTTPTNHNTEEIYNIKGNPWQLGDMPTATDTPTYL